MNKSQTADTPNSSAEFFQYRYAPFSDTFEIHQPFESESETLITQRALALIKQGKSLAIYGEAGSGKSMLIKNIAAQIDSKNYRTVVMPYGGLKPSAILRELCEQFDLDTAGRKNLLCRMAADFNRKNENAFPVIIVDDAHTMQHQSFIDLCSLLHDARLRTVAATLILVGQPVLKKMLELDIYTPVRTRLACLFQMPRLSIDEAKEFVKFRLHIAQADENLFEQQALECIAADSNGNRRVLMNIATLCMEEAARRNEKVITADIVNDISVNFM